ncbi:hypothetical protein LPJ81_002166 [Coemansia sp. IMI 209127]|nr:hypothetical protein LPJ81_002166 [Coemansia sp. IMI 209127]
MERKVLSDEIGYLRKASQLLLLPTSTWATGTVLFHRYCNAQTDVQLKQGGDKLDPHIAMMLCLYLATKITEEPRKQRDIINIGHRLANQTAAPYAVLQVNSPLFNSLRYTMTQGELILMRVLGFNVNVELPHAWIATIIYGMAWWPSNGDPPDDTEAVDVRLKRITRIAWRLANDVVVAGLVDRFPARSIAAVCIVAALDAAGETLPAKGLDEWADMWAKSTGSRITRIRDTIERTITFPAAA